MNRSVTNSDDSFDAIPGRSKESRDEDENERNQFVKLNREPIQVVNDKNTDLKEGWVSNESLHQEETTEKGSTALMIGKDINSPPLVLLPSPTASSDENERWRKDFNCNACPGTPKRNYHSDEASLFFGRSFDSISHTTDLEGAAFGESPHQHRPGIDISLPALLHTDIMDVSPIILGQEEASNILEPLSFQFPNGSIDQHRQRDEEVPTSPHPLPYGYALNRYKTHMSYSNPFYVLRSCSRAFRRCTFVLSHVSNPNPLSVHFSTSGAFNHYQNIGNVNSEYYEPTDYAIACRRVKTAICAFGGSNNSSSPFLRDRDAIFRGVTNWNYQYESRLHKRYHLNGNHISWEIEEHPPIYVEINKGIQNKPRNNADGATPAGSLEGTTARSNSVLATNSTSCSNLMENLDPPKMKYRCKLCGQPKQNHSCPYRQSMQRSIGVSVRSAVNAYEACEPGVLAPALSEMNNFVDCSEQIDDVITGHITSEGGNSSTSEFHSPSIHANKVTPPSSTSSVSSDGARKRKHSELLFQESHISTSFAESVLLCREQYRAVTVSSSENDYEYPSVPLSFLERKKLSDTLFALSKEVAHLTDEVASILHEARERELWDLAVAEILTQVIVALYCGEGDKRLDGLQKYLLTIGIAC